MVRQNQRTVTEVEFSASEKRRMENGEEVEFHVAGETVVATFAEDDELPEVGDRMYDEQPPKWSDGEVEVTEVTNTLAKNHTLDENNCTVAQYNHDYPADDVVVKARYIRDNDKRSGEYSFPASRLTDSPGLGQLFG